MVRYNSVSLCIAHGPLVTAPDDFTTRIKSRQFILEMADAGKQKLDMKMPKF